MSILRLSQKAPDCILPLGKSALSKTQGIIIIFSKKCKRLYQKSTELRPESYRLFKRGKISA